MSPPIRMSFETNQMSNRFGQLYHIHTLRCCSIIKTVAEDDYCHGNMSLYAERGKIGKKKSLSFKIHL